jgi:hypothetical protein
MSTAQHSKDNCGHSVVITIQCNAINVLSERFWNSPHPKGFPTSDVVTHATLSDVVTHAQAASQEGVIVEVYMCAQAPRQRITLPFRQRQAAITTQAILSTYPLVNNTATAIMQKIKEKIQAHKEKKHAEQASNLSTVHLPAHLFCPQREP